MYKDIETYFKEDIGIIQNLYLNEDKDIIVFEDDKRIHVIWVEPDYNCSGFVNHINGIDYLLGSKIIDVELPETKEEEGGDIETIAFKLKTTKGYVDLEFRNETTQYYAVLIHFIPEVDSFEKMKESKTPGFSSWQSGNDFEKEVFKKITQDF